ncbi:hypothetical protein FRC07_002860, partial [Ceratobasidium sp. 392]
MGKNPSHTRKEIEEILESYPHFAQTFNHIPVPEYPTAPFPYLSGPHDAFMCVPCSEHPTHPETFIWRSDKKRTTHWREKHPNHTFSRADEERIRVQTFSDSSTHRRDFRVSEALTAASQHASQGHGNDITMEASRAFVKDWVPSKRTMPEAGANLKQIDPFGMYSNWSAFLAEQNWQMERTLAEKPTNPQLLRVHRTVQPIFTKLMDRLRNLPPPLRRVVTDEENKGGSDAMVALQSEEQWLLHGHTWALLLIYAMRKYERQQQTQDSNTEAPTTNPSHDITFTPHQKDWLAALWRYARDEQPQPKTVDLMLGASAALWAPEVIDHLMEDTFDDAVIRFAIFSNVNEDGSYTSCAVISSFLARIKYIMRLTTLMWTRQQQKEHDRPVSWVFGHIKNTLRASTITPYGNIYHAMGAAVTYKQNYSGLSRVVWGDAERNNLVVDGKTWNVPKLREATGNLIDEIDAELEELLY